MFPSRVHIVEVGPRDGLQNEKGIIALSDKVEFIRRLAGCGLTEIEAGAFVSPKWVPQMADSERVFEALRDGHPDVTYSALVPNEKGMEAALKAGVKKIAVFTAASETFNNKNINCGVMESIERFKPVLRMAEEGGVTVRGYVSTAFVCPFEGEIPVVQAADIVCRLSDLGITDISIGDTIGKATPLMVRSLLEFLVARAGILETDLAMHFHDTFGNALANIDESLVHGIARYDSSAAGIGGCPYAPGASGNVSTNALVRHLHEKGIATGVDIAALDAAAEFIRGVLGR